MSRRTIVSTAEGVAGLVKENLEQLRMGGLKPTRGDARCIAYGHLIRLAIWNLRSGWVKDRPVEEKIRLVADAIESLGGALGVEKLLPTNLSRIAGKKDTVMCEIEAAYGADTDDISF